MLYSEICYFVNCFHTGTGHSEICDFLTFNTLKNYYLSMKWLPVSIGELEIGSRQGGAELNGSLAHFYRMN